LTFDELWVAWKATAAVKPRTADDTRGMLKMLSAFLGHDDARRVQRDDIRRWRDHGLRGGLSRNTWNNRQSMISRVFDRAVTDELLATNPTAGTRLEKAKPKSPLPYTDAEAAAILTCARRETTPMLRWSHWIMAFTGMRVGEVLQLSRDGLRQDASTAIWALAVHENAEGNSVKTGVPRNVPLHQALIDDGFLAYALQVASGAALFPDKGADRYGRRGGRGWNAVGTWVRKTVGIDDAQKAPNHSWRHRMEDELRAAEVPEDVHDAILGHARKTTGRHYGVRGEALSRLHRHLARVLCPIVLTGAAAAAEPVAGGG
jgi:integrase